MEIFGKSLSDFKKPLIVVVVVILVLLFAGVIAANFVLNLGPQVSYKPEADIDFTQVEIPNSSGNETSYMLDMYVENISSEEGRYPGTDYLIVTKAGSKEDTRFTKDVSADPSDHNLVPNNPEQTRTLRNSKEGVILINESDSAYVIGLEKGDVVQVYGSMYGREDLFTGYEVK